MKVIFRLVSSRNVTGGAGARSSTIRFVSCNGLEQDVQRRGGQQGCPRFQRYDAPEQEIRKATLKGSSLPTGCVSHRMPRLLPHPENYESTAASEKKRSDVVYKLRLPVDRLIGHQYAVVDKK